MHCKFMFAQICYRHPKPFWDRGMLHFFHQHHHTIWCCWHLFFVRPDFVSRPNCPHNLSAQYQHPSRVFDSTIDRFTSVVDFTYCRRACIRVSRQDTGDLLARREEWKKGGGDIDGRAWRRKEGRRSKIMWIMMCLLGGISRWTYATRPKQANYATE